MTPRELLAFNREKEIRAVDFRFMDFPGHWKHFTIPVERLTDNVFEDGIGFNASGIRGWQAINESDMLVVPDPDSAYIDPFARERTLTLICNIKDPLTREDYSRDPRNVARKAVHFLRQKRIADVAYFGPEVEFFVFDEVRFDQNQHSAYYYVDSAEGAWNTGREENPNLAHKLKYREGYFPCPPADSFHDLRSEIMLTLQECGLIVESHHHEVATAGQGEIDIRYGELLSTADNVLKYKYIVKNIARKHGKTATFMPKPLFQDCGNGMHIHVSLWKNQENLFAGSRYSGLSEMAEYAIGGLLKHGPALCAITNPTTNSYKRLVPGFDAPVQLAYSSRNRSAAIRIPVYSPNASAKRIEYRVPDAACNPYLGFAGILMAIIDGITNKISPGLPLDKDIYDLGMEELKVVPRLPQDLNEALDALQKDHEFLLQGEVFTEDVIDTWIKFKRESEVEQIRVRPHPYEFALYYDV